MRRLSPLAGFPLLYCAALAGCLAASCVRDPAAREVTAPSTVVVIPKDAPPVAPAPTSSVAARPGDPVTPDGSPVATDDDRRRDPLADGPRDDGTCGAASTPPPPRRTAGDLTVDSPAQPKEQPSYLRLRTHTSGALTSGTKRTWVGSEIPIFVPLLAGAPARTTTRELFLLDPTPGGFFAFYRDPYGAGSCSLGGNGNCAYTAALYACTQAKVWEIDLAPFFSRPDHLEIQDIHFDQGTLYFNEACQSYSKEAGGKCSSLVALDPVARRVAWRTAPLVSNGRFAVAEKYIVAGYGFTAERDFVHLVRRSDGAVVDKKPVATAPQGVRIDGDRVTVTLYPGSAFAHFRIDDASGASARLVAEK